MKRVLLFVFILLFGFSACQTPSNDVGVTAETFALTLTTMSPTVAATINPPETLTICTADLPENLFLYDGVLNAAKENILAVLLDGPFDRKGGEIVPVILKKVPTQGDGDLRLESVSVQRGQTVVDARGELVVLSPGVRVRPSGCRDSDCAIDWDGESTLEMDQMVLDFHLRDGLAWSDGTALTTSDSVFSFELASAPEAGGVKWAEERTDIYETVDKNTIRWIGKPGFSTVDITRFFWTPLPSHLFEGSETWAELAENPSLMDMSLSYGAFQVASRDDAQISLTPNPYYFRADEGLPLLDEIVFREVVGGAPEAWSYLEKGECDLLDSSFGWENTPSLLDEIQNDSRFAVNELPGESWTQLVFGIQPASYDDFYNPSVGDRTDIFGDVRTRQAIAMSLDRQAMFDTAARGLGMIWESFVPPSQSQLSQAEAIPYDPDRSEELLHQVGWQDHDEDPDTPLQAWSVVGVPMGTELSVELIVNTSGFYQALGEIIRNNLEAIGVGVTMSSLSPGEYYAPGPDGPLFGRRFDLALLTWQPMPMLDCGLYQSWGIPSVENQWIGTNVAGFSDEVYDNTCADASLAMPDEWAASLSEAEITFIDSVPAVPLLTKAAYIITMEYGDNALSGDLSNFFDMIEVYSVRENGQ
jgi:peptide/nickel transport system substrate-binding protein